MLINVKMPTVVGILTFNSIDNTTLEWLKARNFFTFWYFNFYDQLKVVVDVTIHYYCWTIVLSWVEHEKELYNLGVWAAFLYYVNRHENWF